MVHIVYVIPYHEMARDVNEIIAENFKDQALSFDILVAKDEDIPSLKIPQGDIFIARGLTAESLKEIGLLCVQVNTTGYDMVVAVQTCIDQYDSKKIAIIGTPAMIGGTEMIHKIFPEVELSCHPVSNNREMVRLANGMDKRGVQAIIGGLTIKKWADHVGFPVVLLHVGREAIRQSIEEAIRIVVATRLESEKTARLQTILDSSFGGIVSVDTSGRIQLCNQLASSALCGKRETPAGLLLTDLIPTLDLGSVFHHNESIRSQIHQLGAQLISVNCIPIITAQKATGAVITFQNASLISEAEGQIRRKLYKKGFVAKKRFADILFQDQKMQETIELARWYASSDSNILIIGETGTGKEIFTQGIHNASSRRSGPFVAINCAALPEQLLESEFFGYVEGAFTGAAKGGKMGLFELAHEGTLFLDEIGDISPHLQSSLLRVLQEREIIRLGDDKVIPINVRIISATNKNLEEMVTAGTFRQDLLYRLEVLKCKLPPLRDRRQDILLLVSHYINEEHRRTNCKAKGISPQAYPILTHFHWPGNVRQLRNFCERVCVFCQDEYADETVVRKALDLEPTTAQPPPRALTALAPIKSRKLQLEYDQLHAALVACSGNRKQAAALLCIDPSTLWRRMKKYGLS